MSWLSREDVACVKYDALSFLVIPVYQALTLCFFVSLQLSSTHLSHLIPTASREAIDLISVSDVLLSFNSELFCELFPFI